MLTQEEMQKKPLGSLFVKRENNFETNYVFTWQRADGTWVRESCSYALFESLRHDFHLSPGEGPIEMPDLPAYADECPPTCQLTKERLM